MAGGVRRISICSGFDGDDLHAVVEVRRHKLVIQVQDRFFSPDARNLPDYILGEAKYGGGLVPQVDNPGANKPKGYGWAAMQWNPALRGRYQSLLSALAGQFDGKVFATDISYKQFLQFGAIGRCRLGAMQRLHRGAENVVAALHRCSVDGAIHVHELPQRAPQE